MTNQETDRLYALWDFCKVLNKLEISTRNRELEAKLISSGYTVHHLLKF